MVFRMESALAGFDLMTVNEALESYWEQQDLPLPKLFILQLVIEELVTNMIKYAGDGPNRWVRIVLETGSADMQLTLTDNTARFDPLAAAEPDISLAPEQREIGGLGLYLVRRKVKSLTYAYIDGQNQIQAVI